MLSGKSFNINICKHIVCSTKEEEKKSLKKKISIIEKITARQTIDNQQSILEIEKEKSQLLETRNELVEARKVIL